MIGAAISHIAVQLNQHLKSRFELHEDVLVISDILEQDGRWRSISITSSWFLINIESGTTPQRPRQTAAGGDRNLVSFPPTYLILYLIFAAHSSCENYPEEEEQIVLEIDVNNHEG